VAAGSLYGILRLPAAEANTRTPLDVQTRLVRTACCGKPVADDTRHITGPRGSRCHAVDVEKASFTKRLIEHGSRVPAAAATDVQRALSRGSLLWAAISLARVRGVKRVVVAYNVATGLLAATLALAVGRLRTPEPSIGTADGSRRAGESGPESGAQRLESTRGIFLTPRPLSHSRRPTPVTPSRSQRGGRALTRRAV